MTDIKCGRNGDLIIEGRIDRDGEIEVNIPSSYHTDESITWIGRDDAIKIIEHLKSVFNI